MSLLHADLVNHNYPAHTHDAYVIAVTEAGGARVINGRHVDTVSQSTLFISNPEERQSASMVKGSRWLYRSFYLTERAAQYISERLGIPETPGFDCNLLDDSELIARFIRLHRSLERRHDSMGADEALISAFAVLYQRHGKIKAKLNIAQRDKILSERAADLMRERFMENITLDELAAHIGVTNFHLIGLFKRTVGLTPHAYLIRLRLNAACHAIKSGKTLAESAAVAGFCDQSAFTGHLKRWYAITPAQFSQANLLHDRRGNGKPHKTGVKPSVQEIKEPDEISPSS